jgi:hypothetical protein
MNKVKVSLVIQSMLNDAMIEVKHSQLMEDAQERLRFVKYLIHTFPNTSRSINVDSVFTQFQLSNK